MNLPSFILFLDMENFSDVKVYLYDASGKDEELNFENVEPQRIGDKQMLWVNIFKRDEKLLAEVAKKLEIEQVKGTFLKKIIATSERPKLDKFEDLYRFFIVSVKAEKGKTINKVPIDFLVGKNFVITVSDCQIDYFDEFIEREQGETNIGELDSESFVAALLDLHIVSYFRVLEEIEAQVDELDDKILGGKTEYKEFLGDIVKLRSDVSKLRRWFLPHRDVFYALSRPDFFPADDSDATEYFRILSEHFDNAVEVIEGSRDTVIGLFDLYAARTNERTNQVMQRLTFITLLVGGLGVFAGAMGMNFKLDFFESDNGFFITVGVMGAFAIIFILLSFWRKWI